jgi:hypothetical protein
MDKLTFMTNLPIERGRGPMPCTGNPFFVYELESLGFKRVDMVSYGSRTTRRPSPDSINSMPLRQSFIGTTMLEIMEMSKPLASRFRA